MHDREIEDRLRTALRAEGDALPLTITTAELERRLAMHRRARDGHWARLLAAGVAVVVGRIDGCRFERLVPSARRRFESVRSGRRFPRRKHGADERCAD